MITQRFGTPARFIVAFLLPFVLVVIVLIKHEKDEAYDSIQQMHSTLGQATFQPDDDKRAWRSAVDASTLLATPFGLLGLVGYGCFVTGKKLQAARRK